MKTNDLKNYGLPMTDTTINLSMRDNFKVMPRLLKIMKDNLGILNFLRLTMPMLSIKRKMLKQNFSKIKARGFNNNKFIKKQIESAALYVAMREMIGKEASLEIMKKIIEELSKVIFQSVFPTPEDLKRCGDPMNAMKEYFQAMWNTEKAIGSFDHEVIEYSDNIYQINVTYCIYQELGKILGVEEIDFCYADDAYLPDYCRQFSAEFIRTGTLLRGGYCCDYRFERKK